MVFQPEPAAECRGTQTNGMESLILCQTQRARQMIVRGDDQDCFSLFPFKEGSGVEEILPGIERGVIHEDRILRNALLNQDTAHDMCLGIWFIRALCSADHNDAWMLSVGFRGCIQAPLQLDGRCAVRPDLSTQDDDGVIIILRRFHVGFFPADHADQADVDDHSDQEKSQNDA